MQDKGQFPLCCSVLAWNAGEPGNATFEPRLAGIMKVFIEEAGSVQFSSFAQSCPTLCIPMDCSTPGFPAHHQLPEPAQIHIKLVTPSNHIIVCHPLLLLPSIFPSIRVLSNESALHIRWLKHWSFSISPSNEYSGLIFFRIDWFSLSLLISIGYLP